MLAACRLGRAPFGRALALDSRLPAVARGLSSARWSAHRDESAWYGQQLRATTILSVRKDNKVFIIGDGQVTLGSQVIKPNARKVRVIRPGVVCGFAGATADANEGTRRCGGRSREVELEAAP